MITEIGQRLRKLRKSKGYDQDALAQASGITQSAISNIETGTTKNPSSDTLTKLANALGIPVGDLYGQRALSQQISEARAPYGPREVILRPASSLEGPGKAISADYLEIPLVTGRVAAGASQAVDEEIEPSPVLIHAAQVRGRHDLVAVRVVGNSMLPILQPGSIVAIDRGDKRITPGGIYAVRDGDGVTIKGAEWVKPFLILKPENRAEEVSHIQVHEEEAPEDYIVGRVIWAWQPFL